MGFTLWRMYCYSKTTRRFNMGTDNIRSHRDTAATIEVLREQIEVFRSRIEEHDTGHLYTTISTLEHRIEELEKEYKEKLAEGYMSSYE